LRWIEYFIPVLFVAAIVTFAYFFGDKLEKVHRKKSKQEFEEVRDYLIDGGETPKVVKKMMSKETDIVRIRKVIEDNKVNHFYN
jgi:hypothetical protein